MKLLQNLNVILYFFACSLAKVNMSHFSQFLLNWILMHYSPPVYTQQETPKAHFADKQLLLKNLKIIITQTLHLLQMGECCTAFCSVGLTFTRQ